MESHQTKAFADDGPENLSFQLIVRLISGGWRVILTLTALLVILAILIGVLSPRTYRTFYIAMPAPTTNDPTRNSTAGLDLLGKRSGPPEWEMYISLLTSTNLSQRLIDTTPILKLLFPDSWDAKTKQWKTKTDFWSEPLIGKVHWILGERTKRVPDKFALQSYLMEHLHSVPVPDTSQYTMIIDSADPKTALILLTAVHHAANDIVRETQLSRSVDERINLLQQLNTTQISDYRRILLEILSRVETSVMTASIKGQYASILVDGPVSDPFPVFPNTKLFTEFAIVAGLVGGLAMVIFTPVNDLMLISAWITVKRRIKRRFAGRIEGTSAVPRHM